MVLRAESPRVTELRQHVAIVSRAVSITADQWWERNRRRREMRAAREIRQEVEVVYFVRGGEALKIGTAKNVVKRFEALQAGSPLTLQLVGLIHGGVNVERWCHFHCVNHRLHYEWFCWNSWTEAFVRWVLAHGDDAALTLCPRQMQADGLYPGRSNDVRCHIGPLPQMKFWRRGDRGLPLYLKYAKLDAAPLGACHCDHCTVKPWETWR